MESRSFVEWPCLPSSAVPLLDAIDRHDNFLPNTTTGKTIFAFIYLFRKLSIQPFALPPFFLAFICALLSPIADVIQLSVSMATWQLFSAGDGRESNGLQRRHVQEALMSIKQWLNNALSVWRNTRHGLVGL